LREEDDVDLNKERQVAQVLIRELQSTGRSQLYQVSIQSDVEVSVREFMKVKDFF
jgi:hypothetical protein